MAHDHSHDHGHAHSHAPAGVSSRKLAWAVALTLAFVAGEAIAGYFSKSLALLSDAGHNFADAAALAFSWYAMWIARKPASSGMTYGYHRVGILAALVNSVSLVVIALFIVGEAISRLRHPGPVNSWLMIGVAALAVAVNVVITVWLHGGKQDLNVRSAYIHMLGDAVSAFGVVIAGVIVALTKASIADPIVSFLIAALILWSSWGILKESVNVLLEGTPAGIDMEGVIRSIKDVGGVLDVYDLHVWAVGSGVVACSCHIRVADQTIRDGQQILKRVVAELDHHHTINHTTIQLEVETRDSTDLYCCVQPSNEAVVGHHH